jgi:thiol-disulfide isomerase/thioredoxin
LRKYARLITTLVLIGLLATMVAGALTGCAANDQLSQQFRSGDNKNYIAGDGSVTEFSPENRVAPAPWSGVTESGDVISSDQLKGVVQVINFWYAGCAPCRAEAADLVALAEEHQGKVQFVGVNVRDTAATALAFDRNFKITWPSVMDATSGEVVLAFTGIVTPQAVPTTLVVDRSGKVTARVLGRIDRSILNTLIKSAIEE